MSIGGPPLATVRARHYNETSGPAPPYGGDMNIPVLWLSSELRIKRGLTYGARSGLQSWRQGG